MGEASIVIVTVYPRIKLDPGNSKEVVGRGFRGRGRKKESGLEPGILRVRGRVHMEGSAPWVGWELGA